MRVSVVALLAAVAVASASPAADISTAAAAQAAVDSQHHAVPRQYASSIRPCWINLERSRYPLKNDGYIALRPTPCNQRPGLTNLYTGDEIMKISNVDSLRFGCNYWYNKITYKDPVSGKVIEGWVHEKAIDCDFFKIY